MFMFGFSDWVQSVCGKSEHDDVAMRLSGTVADYFSASTKIYATASPSPRSTLTTSTRPFARSLFDSLEICCCLPILHVQDRNAPLSQSAMAQANMLLRMAPPSDSAARPTSHRNHIRPKFGTG
jgi:hypothetical protein